MRILIALAVFLLTCVVLVLVLGAFGRPLDMVTLYAIPVVAAVVAFFAYRQTRARAAH